MGSILLILYAAITSTYAQKEQAPIPIEEALSAHYLTGSISLSPGGEWVAYTLCSAARKEPVTADRADLYLFFDRNGVPRSSVGCSVWIANTVSAKSKNLISESEGSSWQPVWSPDGNYLAFYSDRNGPTRLWVWARRSGKVRQLSEVTVLAIYNRDLIRWTPDSRAILTKALPEGMTVEEFALSINGNPREAGIQKNETRSTVVIYSSQASTNQRDSTQQIDGSRFNVFDRATLADLALMDLSSGKVERIARRIHSAGYWISPDGIRIAYSKLKGYEDAVSAGAEQAVCDLVVTSIAGAGTHIVGENLRTGGANVSWSPDGKLLSYTTDGRLAKGDCFVASIEGGTRNITQLPHPNFSGQIPLWNATGDSIYLVGDNALWRVSVAEGTLARVAQVPHRQLIGVVARLDRARVWFLDTGRSVYLSTRDAETKQAGFYKVDLTTGESSRLLEDDKSFGGVDISDAGNGLVYVAEDAETPADVWATSLDFRNPHRVTRSNPQLDRYQMGKSQLIEWRSVGGERLQGALLLPSNYEAGKRYPLIVYTYPEYISNNVNRFGAFNAAGPGNMQLLATRGYAVLLPDTPLREGGSRMRDLAKEIMPGVDKVVEMGVADPERLGIMGHSLGGYTALSLIVQTNRFKAAISSAPRVPNLTGVYGMMLRDGTNPFVTFAERAPAKMGGSLWEFRDKYIENSPTFYLDRVQTPLLLIYGALDYGSFQADEVFVGLRRLGKEVVYASYEGEFHWEGDWSYANQVDYLNRVIEWFDQKLKTPKRTSSSMEQTTLRHPSRTPRHHS